MEISLISDPISSIASSTQSLGFSNLYLKRSHNGFSLSDVSSDHSKPIFQVSAASRPPTKTLNRPRLRSNRRVKRKTSLENDGDDINYNSLFGFTGGDYSSFGDAYFGGGGGDSSGFFGNGGGGGGSSGGGGGYGGSNWEDSAENSVPDPAFDLVYGVLSVIALSNCLVFSCKKAFVKFIGDREKVAIQLTTVC